MSEQKKIPITRNNKFFGHEDFRLEVEMGREAIEGDGNFVVILYRVDREMTESDDLYGEASKDGIAYFPPLELRVIPIMRTPENKTYNRSAGTLRYLEDGQLTFGIYDDQLQELDTDISYGDYIGYPVTETDIRYFSVVNDGRKNYDNAHTIMGYKGAFRTVLCAPVDPNEFRGL
jgi:hypothetical protein